MIDSSVSPDSFDKHIIGKKIVRTIKTFKMILQKYAFKNC
jgi:hypothetical protein